MKYINCSRDKQPVKQEQFFLSGTQLAGSGSVLAFGAWFLGKPMRNDKLK